VPVPDTSSYHKPNVFNTRTPVKYAYRNRTFSGYLGNYWSPYNGTDTGKNGVGTTPQPVFRNNTDYYPLISRTDAYDLNPKPRLQADFTASPRNGTAPLSVQFTDKSTGNPLHRQWNFGDSPLTFTGTNPVHVYRTSGTFNVTLSIADLNGTSTKKKVAFITVIAKPKAKFFANATYGFPPLSVQFTDRSTESPTAWSWDFGDGTNSTLQNPVHTYKKAGTYTVRLNATNTAGSGSLTKTGYILVPVLPVYPV
jgi:PKD repeat protein